MQLTEHLLYPEIKDPFVVSSVDKILLAKRDMMKTCTACASWLKYTKDRDILMLERSFTKIGDQLHLGFDHITVCKSMANYIPETIILAGNGAVEITDGYDCWKVLEQEMRELGLVGEKAYGDPLDGLTWLVAHHDLFGRGVYENSKQWITQHKRKIIGALNRHETHSREMYCTSCNKRRRLPNSEKILVLTTNWDLGLLREFKNVVQLHGRCDYPEHAILPLQNVSLLIARSGADILSMGSLPGPFLERCFKGAKSLIFWGSGLRDYDAVLWHFLYDCLKGNSSLEIGIASKDSEGFFETQKKVLRYFPAIPIRNCLCDMIPT